jgi:hypothetical protein
MSNGRNPPESDEELAGKRQYMSRKELAAKTGLSLSTIDRLLAKKKLAKDQPGGKGTRVLIPIGAIASATPEATEMPKGLTDGRLTAAASSGQACLSGKKPLWMSSQGATKR